MYFRYVNGNRLRACSKAVSEQSVVRFRLHFLCVLVSAVASIASASSLTWDNSVCEIQVPPLAEKVDAVFRFTNTGKTRVSIVSAAASCGCTVPQITKTVYAPGEKGELHALFTPDDRVGLRQEEVMVLTDEPGQAPQVLVLRMTVPKLYEVTPYFVLWHGGEEPSPKKIKIHFTDPALLKPTSIHSRDARVTASIESIPYSPGDYTVSVRPASTATALDTMITVDLTASTGAKRVITLYAVVRSAQTSPVGAH